MQLVGAPGVVALDEVGVAPLELGGREHVPGHDAVAEARGVALDPVLDAVDHPGDLSVGDGPRGTAVADPERDVRVGPGRLGAGWRACGVGGGHLAQDDEGVIGHVRAADGRGLHRQLVDRVGEVHGARARDGGVPPRDGGAQRPVDLHRGPATLVAGEGGHRPVGEVVEAHEPAQQHLGVDVGEHGSPGADRGAGDLDADGSSTLDHHPLDRGAAPQAPAGALQPADERGGELPGPAHGGGEADVLGQRRQQPAEEPARRGVGGHVGVQGVARQEQLGGVAGVGLVEARGRGLGHPVQHGSRAVGPGVGDHGGCLGPRQAMASRSSRASGAGDRASG